MTDKWSPLRLWPNLKRSWEVTLYTASWSLPSSLSCLFVINKFFSRCFYTVFSNMTEMWKMAAGCSVCHRKRRIKVFSQFCKTSPVQFFQNFGHNQQDDYMSPIRVTACLWVATKVHSFLRTWICGCELKNTRMVRIHNIIFFSLYSDDRSDEQSWVQKYRALLHPSNGKWDRKRETERPGQLHIVNWFTFD